MKGGNKAVEVKRVPNDLTPPSADHLETFHRVAVGGKLGEGRKAMPKVFECMRIGIVRAIHAKKAILVAEG